MHKAIEMIRRTEQKTTEWSGGMTTEVAIFPRDAQYRLRNFIWRISAATVETDYSVFTALPGIWRVLMVTDGHLDLRHEGHHDRSLEPFQHDAFSGSWTTQSWGQARDFNVMVSDPYEATIKAILGDAMGPGYRDMVRPNESEGQGWEMFYDVTGRFSLWIGDAWEARLGPGDLLVVDRSCLTSPLELVITRELGPAPADALIRVSIMGPDSSA